MVIGVLSATALLFLTLEFKMKTYCFFINGKPVLCEIFIGVSGRHYIRIDGHTFPLQWKKDSRVDFFIFHDWKVYLVSRVLSSFELPFREETYKFDIDDLIAYGDMFFVNLTREDVPIYLSLQEIERLKQDGKIS